MSDPHILGDKKSSKVRVLSAVSHSIGTTPPGVVVVTASAPRTDNGWVCPAEPDRICDDPVFISSVKTRHNGLTQSNKQSNKQSNTLTKSNKTGFDKRAYQREYMRKRRAAKRLNAKN